MVTIQVERIANTEPVSIDVPAVSDISKASVKGARQLTVCLASRFLTHDGIQFHMSAVTARLNSWLGSCPWIMWLQDSTKEWSASVQETSQRRQREKQKLEEMNTDE